MFALDNEYHTAKDLAAMNSKDDILRYLDNVCAKQEQNNPKVSSLCSLTTITNWFSEEK